MYEMIRSVNKIEEWFLKVRYDPYYSFCRRCVNKEFNNYYNNTSN